MIEFKPMSESESARLLAALRGNAETGKGLLLSPRDTTFSGTEEERETEATINAVRSIPRHYADETRCDEFTLRRSGLPPLRFSGELVAESDGQRRGGKDRTRWHELAVYCTESGKYVIAICYRTIWEGELDHDKADVCATAQDAVECLAAHDPTQFMQQTGGGYPRGEAYDIRRFTEVQSIKARYDDQVADILGSLPSAAEVVK